MPVEPPNFFAFSTTRTLRPSSAAARAAVIPPPPEPTMTRSNSSSKSCVPVLISGLPRQEGDDGGFPGGLRLDHRPVAAVGEHVHHDLPDGPHREQHNVARAEPGLAPPGTQGGPGVRVPHS